MVKLQKTVHLNIIRTLADGRKIKVGELAENRQGIFFAYDEHYRQYFPHLSLSPFKLRFEQGLQLAPKEPHNGLHGVFADSLPDGWECCYKIVFLPPTALIFTVFHHWID